MDALEKAKLAVGGASQLARLLTEAGQPITSQAVTQWRRVPVGRALQVEKITGVPLHELRPDVYPSASEAA